MSSLTDTFRLAIDRTTNSDKIAYNVTVIDGNAELARNMYAQLAAMVGILALLVVAAATSSM